MRVGFTTVRFRSASEDDQHCSVVNVKLGRTLLFRQGEIRRNHGDMQRETDWGDKKPF